MNNNDAAVALSGATELREGRREMVAGMSKKTPHGEVFIKIKIDMPGRVSEDEFKKIMVELGEALTNGFGR